jgi:hypothetical protein
LKRIVAVIVFCVVAVLSGSITRAGDFFIGAGLGQSSARNTLQATTFDADDTGWEAHFGYRLSPYVFFEGSYVDFGSFQQTAQLSEFDVDVQAAALWAAGNIPFADIVHFYVKLGVAYTQADSVVTPPLGDPERSTDSDTNIAWGIGFAVDLGKIVTIRAEFDSYQVDDIQSLEFLWIGAQINF